MVTTILEFLLWPIVIYLSYRIILFAVKAYEKKYKV
jgi:hypothetical protein